MTKELITLGINEIQPYERNPRRNDAAVDDLVESIKQAGYIAPIIVDENNVILAGHTRYKALQKIGKADALVMKVTGMTEAQKRKYRLLDNKVSEKSGWDYELLDWELEDIDFEGYDFGFETMGGSLDLDDSDFLQDTEITKSKEKEVTCPHCGEKFMI